MNMEINLALSLSLCVCRRVCCGFAFLRANLMLWLLSRSVDHIFPQIEIHSLLTLVLATSDMPKMPKSICHYECKSLLLNSLHVFIVLQMIQCINIGWLGIYILKHISTYKQMLALHEGNLVCMFLFFSLLCPFANTGLCRLISERFAAFIRPKWAYSVD